MKRLLAICLLFVSGGVFAEAPRFENRTVASADGVRIHYVVGGRGEPALVFVHCWSCDAGYWREQLPVFARDHRVVAIDLAGHGTSSDKRARFTMAAFGADVAAVVRQEKLDRVVLIGHSMGGPVVLEAAQLLPGRVALVVGVDNMQDAEAKFPEEFFKQLHDGMVKDFKGTTDAFVRTMFRKDADPRLVADIAADMASAPPRVAISAIEEIKAFDVAGAMQKAGVPIVCINSTTYPTAIETNRKHAKSFDVVLIDDVGHFIMREKPQAFDAALTRVLAERGLGTAPR